LPQCNANVADVVKTEVSIRRVDFSFAPISGHRQAASACPKSANSGHPELDPVLAPNQNIENNPIAK